MQCPHCLNGIHPSTTNTTLSVYNTAKFTFGAWKGDSVNICVRCHICPSCGGPTVELRFVAETTIIHELRVFPREARFLPAPPEVPLELATDYGEANSVVSISPKASAALSRRCLQAMLKDAGYQNDNLAKQIDNAIAEQRASHALPSDLRNSLDAIRNFGNFSAHPISDRTTLQVIEVDEGEAEWCLQLIFELFQHYYVRPERASERRSALNAKLEAAGKPPMKGLSEPR